MGEDSLEGLICMDLPPPATFARFTLVFFRTWFMTSYAGGNFPCYPSYDWTENSIDTRQINRKREMNF